MTTPAHYRVLGELDLVPAPKAFKVTLDDMYGHTFGVTEIIDDQGHYQFTVKVAEVVPEQKISFVGMVTIRSGENQILVAAPLSIERPASQAPPDEDKFVQLDPLSTFLAITMKSAVHQGKDGAQLAATLEKKRNDYEQNPDVQGAVSSMMQAIEKDPDQFTALIAASVAPLAPSSPEKADILQGFSDFLKGSTDVDSNALDLVIAKAEEDIEATPVDPEPKPTPTTAPATPTPAFTPLPSQSPSSPPTPAPSATPIPGGSSSSSGGGDVPIVRHVTGVIIDVVEFTLNAMPEEGLPAPNLTTQQQLNATVFANTSTHGVSWSSSDVSRVIVSSSGLVSTVRGALAGRATITATSIDDPAKKAIANVIVTAKGEVPIEILSEKRAER
ncbi:MAG TPA: hypothetical protein DD435_02845 [Cyanobacteria bacterium UBA8530]|nr:hypothetical protein [Cyanobacteria bacterium UBA8530]